MISAQNWAHQYLLCHRTGLMSASPAVLDMLMMDEKEILSSVAPGKGAHILVHSLLPRVLL